MQTLCSHQLGLEEVTADATAHDDDAPDDGRSPVLFEEAQSLGGPGVCPRVTPLSKKSWLVPVLLLGAGSLALLSALYRLFVTGEALATGVLSADPTDHSYVHHPFITALHLVPGIAFLLLGPLQFAPSVLSASPRLHRLSGRVFVGAGLIVGATAIVMNVVFPPVGGPMKSAAVFVFGVAQIVTLLVALAAILRRDVPTHRAWMIRAFAIGLGVSTQRLFFIPLYAAYGLPSDRTIGLGMWFGFLLNVAVAELILFRSRVAPKPTMLTR